MNLALRINNYTPSRQDKLDAFLALRKIQKSEIAKNLGISPQMLTQIFNGRCAPPLTIDKLIEMGIPADLLPTPKPQRGMNFQLP